MKSGERLGLTALSILFIFIGLAVFILNLPAEPSKYFLVIGALLVIVFSFVLISGKAIGLYGLEGALLGLIVVNTWGQGRSAEPTPDYIIGFIIGMFVLPTNWPPMILLVLLYLSTLPIRKKLT